MESLVKIFRIFFAENYILIVILAFSWIPLYYLHCFIEYLARKLLLRLPYHFRIRKLRRELGLAKLRYEIAVGRWEPAIQLAKRDHEIIHKFGRTLSALDKELSIIMKGNHWAARALNDESVATEVKNIVTKDVVNLEADYYFCQAVAGKDKNSPIGIMYIVDNPNTKFSERIGILYYSMICGTANAQNVARYHLAKKMRNTKQQEKMNEIVSKWPESIQAKVDETIDTIKAQAVGTL